MATGSVVKVARWSLVRVGCTCQVEPAVRSLETRLRSFSSLGVGGLPCVKESDVRDVLEQHSQETACLFSLGRGAQHGLVEVEVDRHHETVVGGKGE